MKTIRKKIISGILMCSLLTTVITGALAMINSTQMEGSNSRQKMQLWAEMEALELNSVISEIEQSVETLSDVLMNGFDYASFVKNMNYADDYTKQISQVIDAFGEKTNGAITAYIRYNPQYSRPTSGYFITRSSVESEFESVVPTDFSMYDEEDAEHVGWYYTPVKAGRAIWMDPYLNANINVYMISYVVPLFAQDGTSIGIVGMDIDFSQITNLVDSLSFFETGYAFFANESGAVVHSKNVENGTQISSLDPSLAGIEELFRDDKNQGETFSYSVRNVKKHLVYYNLDNGMKLVLAVPDSEIYARANLLVIIILTAALIAMTLSGIVGVMVGSNISRPIRQLTAVIEQTSKLDFRSTESGEKLCSQKDEIGVMAREIRSMRKILREMLQSIDKAEKTILDNVTDLNDIMEKNRVNAQENSAATQEIAAGMQEASANTARIMQSIEEVKNNSGNIFRLAESGEINSRQIQERADEMERNSRESREKTDEMYAVMKQKTDLAVEQSKAVKKINELTDDIKKISSQTNLLALNASIEAARAGEAGRGFAVVASEIGTLAAQTLQTVGNINGIVGEVNEAVSNMTDCIMTVMKFLESTVLGDYENFSRSGAQYLADADDFQQTMGQTKQAIGFLDGYITQIAETVENINDMVTRSTNGINSIAGTSGEAQNIAVEGYTRLQECRESMNALKEIISHFQL